METFKIVIAEESMALRRSIQRLLGRWPEFEIVGHTDNAEALMTMLAEQTPGAVIVDADLNGLFGLSSIADLKRVCAETKVILLSVKKSKPYVTAAMAAGADGCLLKTDSDVEFIAAVLAVQRGKTYISGMIEEG